MELNAVVVEGPDRGSGRSRCRVPRRVGGAAAARRQHRVDRGVVEGVASARVHPGARPGPGAGRRRCGGALEEIGADQRAWIATARAKIRRQVWALIEARHGGIPASQVADVDLGPTVVIRMDATIQIAPSDKEQATCTFSC